MRLLAFPEARAVYYLWRAYMSLDSGYLHSLVLRWRAIIDWILPVCFWPEICNSGELAEDYRLR
jgi:hypothetical protein